MLLDQQQPGGSGQVAVVTRNPVFTRLLSTILESWKLKVVDDRSSAELILIEWGLAAPASDGQLVWLTPLPIKAPHFEIPLKLTLLYRLLEERFFPSSRRFMRIPVDLPVDLLVAGQRFPSQLISLSARGARVNCPVQLANKQALAVEVVLGGHRLELPGDVLYSLPSSDASRTEWPQLGVLFKLGDVELSEALERFVELVCVEQCCAKLGLPMKSHCVSWLDVSLNPWRGFSDSGDC